MEHSTFQLPNSLWTISNYYGKIPGSDSFHHNVTLAFQFFNVLEPCQILTSTFMQFRLYVYFVPKFSCSLPLEVQHTSLTFDIHVSPCNLRTNVSMEISIHLEIQHRDSYGVTMEIYILSNFDKNNYIGLQNKNTWWTFHTPSPIHCHRGHNRVILKV
jgi:hypothetical protein